LYLYLLICGGKGRICGEPVRIPADQFIDTLKVGRAMNEDSFEKLAEILLFIAEGDENKVSVSPEKKKIFERALILFEYLDAVSSTYSFDRHNKIVKIRNI
jgi:hypothetical protein